MSTGGVKENIKKPIKNIRLKKEPDGTEEKKVELLNQ